MKHKYMAALPLAFIFVFALSAGAQTETPPPVQVPIADAVAVPDPFDAAVANIASADPAVRRRAADFLAQSRDQKAKPYLIAALKDESAQVRRAAVDGLGMLSARETVPQLSEMLADDKDSGVRQTVAIAFSYMMDPAAGPALLAALKDDIAAVRYAAVHTLGAMKYAPAEDPLILLLKEEDSGLRRVAIAALGDLQSEKAAPAILKMFQDEDKYIRLEAVRAIGNIGDKTALGELKSRLDAKEYPAVRVEAALALSKMGDPAGLETAYEFVRSPDLSLKGQALTVVGNIGDARSLSLIEELYRAEQNPVNKDALDFTRQNLAARLKIKLQE